MLSRKISARSFDKISNVVCQYKQAQTYTGFTYKIDLRHYHEICTLMHVSLVSNFKFSLLTFKTYMQTSEIPSDEDTVTWKTKHLGFLSHSPRYMKLFWGHVTVTSKSHVTPPLKSHVTDLGFKFYKNLKLNRTDFDKGSLELLAHVSWRHINQTMRGRVFCGDKIAQLLCNIVR